MYNLYSHLVSRATIWRSKMWTTAEELSDINPHDSGGHFAPDFHLVEMRTWQKGFLEF